MRMYHVLTRIIERKDCLIEDYQADQVYGDQYMEGVHLESQRPIRLFYESASQRKTDYLSGLFSFPVISARFKTLLLAEGVKHLEFHPVQLICRANQEIDDTYSFLNILDNVPCLDRENSEYETFSGTDEIISVEKFALKEEELHNRDLVRIRDYPIPIFVSPRLSSAIVAARLTGIKLTAVDDYRWYS